jgi:hypothetical protein
VGAYDLDLEIDQVGVEATQVGDDVEVNLSF